MSLEQQVFPANQIDFEKIINILKQSDIQIVEHLPENILKIKQKNKELFLKIENNSITIMNTFNLKSKFESNEVLKLMNRYNESFKELKFSLRNFNYNELSQDDLELHIESRFFFGYFFSIQDFIQQIINFNSKIDTFLELNSTNLNIEFYQ